MNGDALLDLWRTALETMLTVGSPFLAAALVVGLTTSIFQAATQLQENVLSFVPKLAALGLILALAGPWLLGQLAEYTRGNFDMLGRTEERAR